jgi:hypothetical protein
MTSSTPRHDLDRFPKALRIGDHDAWLADPEDIVTTLTSEGFQEYRREVIRCRRDRRPLGGIWQALEPATGHVVSIVWLNRGTARPAVVFVDRDDEPVPAPDARQHGNWWDEVDEAVLDCLSGGASMAPADVGRRLGISEEAATSVIAMLAQEGKLRICLVASTDSDLVERSVRCPVRGQQVTVQFLESHIRATPVAVKWCTAFQPPTAVQCDQDCVASERPVAAAATAA